MRDISVATDVGHCRAADANDDEGVLVRAAQVNRAAFGPLYERYVTRVYAYLRARTPTPEDAADLTQQVFLQAIDALPRYRLTGTPFAAWLFRIARNVASNFQRRQRSTVTWDLVPEALQPVAADDPAADVIRTEALARLHALFVALDRDTRELLILRFTARLTVAEIAAVVGASEGATRMRLVRALRTLKEHHDDHTF